MIIALSLDVERGVVIGFATNLGRGSNGFLAGKNLSRNLGLPMANTIVVGTPHMVLTNPIIITHAKPLMSSIVIKGYKSTNAQNSEERNHEPLVITHGILDHINGHFVKTNKVALKYPDFKKNADPNAHVKMFNYEVKVNVETLKKISSMCLTIRSRDTTLDSCHNYMSKFLSYIFSEHT
jgi:hypothetical protein